MTADELRALFLNFFKEKGHDIIPGASLIPHGDPTLLFTSAGMVPLKPYYLGELVPPNVRLTSCQKSFRTTDIELVGDPSHLTFFEMLGNFSIGDYFKRETIGWAWEFATQHLGFAPERLWATIYLDDEESFRYWREAGVPEARIRRFGEEHNYWGPAGDTGPCGPCSEIHYDFGEEFGCGQPSCEPNCECGRFSEIWNLVFTQYDQQEDGTRILLPRPNIDTGMGLERTLAILQGKKSVYETGLFTPLLEGVARLCGQKYGSDDETDNAMRVVVEHGRALTFLIADGVIPGNEGRGYVLRRLLRRAALFGRRLGLDKPFLTGIAKATADLMGHVYPEIRQRQDFITKSIELEEARFSGTLSAGLELLDDVVGGLSGKGEREISGKQAFKLYDTYGFPVELTGEIAKGRGFSVDLKGFEQEMEKQRRKARAGHKFEMTEKTVAGLHAQFDIEKTDFVGHQNLKCESAVIHLLADNKSVRTVVEGQKADLILDNTPFYGEMGGQAGDTGEIKSISGQFVVTDTVRIPPDIIVHQGYVAEGSLDVGDEVEAVVDKERRLDIARNHTATHLLYFALRKVLGEHVQQRGSLVASERFSFDFSHLTAMTEEEIGMAQKIVNEKVRQNLRVYAEELPYKEAIKAGAIALFDEKYGDVVRVLKIGEPPISIELCGGTHVGSTGEIGLFHIFGEHGIGAGLRRIEAVTGRGTEENIERRLSVLDVIMQIQHASIEDVQDKVSSTASGLDMERRQRLALERELARIRAESLLSQAEVIKGVTVLAAKIPPSRLEILREMSDLIRDKLKSVVVVLGTVCEGKPVFIAAVTRDLVAKGYNAGDIVKQVAKVAGGGGGGKPDIAQAGGKHKDKLDEALRLVKTLI